MDMKKKQKKHSSVGRHSLSYERDSEWPIFNVIEGSDSANEERIKATVLRVQSEPVLTISSVIDIVEYGSLLELLRVTIMVLRFIDNLKGKRAHEKMSTGELEA